MTYELENTALNDVLCYISTARHTMTNDNITLISVAFYKPEVIKKSKKLLFEICKEIAVYKERKSCASHPNPATAEVSDILELLETCEAKKFLLPDFVAGSYTSLPPATGFESLATIMCSMRDEVIALRMEVSEVKQIRQNDAKSLEGVGSVTQDVLEIKNILANRSVNQVTNAPSSSYADVCLNPLQQPPSTIHESGNTTFGNVSAESLQRTQNDASRSGRRESFTSVSNRVNGVSHRGRAHSGRQNGNGAVRQNGNSAVYLNGTSAVHQNSNGAGRQNGNGSVRQNGNVASMNGRQNRRNIISGTRNASEGGLLGVQRVVDIYLGGCEKNTTDEMVKKYCADNGVNVRKCETLNTNSEWYSCFKISVFSSEREKLFNAEFWPRCVFVRNFFRSRARD